MWNLDVLKYNTDLLKSNLPIFWQNHCQIRHSSLSDTCSVDGVTSQRIESVKVFLPTGHFTWHSIWLFFQSFYFISFGLVIFHPTRWSQHRTHAVILPQFYFILYGPFFHHKVSKWDGCLVTRYCDNTGPDWGPYSGIQVDEFTAYLETSPSVLMVLRYAFVSAYKLIPLLNADGHTPPIDRSW